MRVNEKEPAVKSNPTDNEKQITPDNQVSTDKKGDDAKKSPAMEEGTKSTEENKEHEDMKHPHKQGAPVAVDNKSKTGI